jgi:hypothetical protein
MPMPPWQWAGLSNPTRRVITCPVFGGYSEFIGKRRADRGQQGQCANRSGLQQRRVERLDGAVLRAAQDQPSTDRSSQGR